MKPIRAILSAAQATPLLLGFGLLFLVPQGGCSEEAASPVVSGPSFAELSGGGKPAEARPEAVKHLPTLALQGNSIGLPEAGSWREHPTLADLDGDGRADLVASNREENGLNVWRSVPGEAWIPELGGIPEDLMYGGSACADLDGDGDLDILFASHKSGLQTLLNDGDMIWTLLEETAELAFLGLDVAVGNLNGDEHVDAVIIAQFVDRGQGALGVYFGRGDGTFEYRPELRNSTGDSRNGVQVELADLDGDGLDDLFLTAEWGCQILLPRLTSEGDVRFEDRSSGLPTPPHNMGNVLRAFIPIDVDGDGRLEVAFGGLCNPQEEVSERDSLGVYRWNETQGSWEPFGSGLPDGLAYTDVLTADFDGDRRSDLLIIGPGIGASIYLGDGQGGFEAKGLLEGTLAGGRGAVGDIDGDGKPDIAVINTATKSRADGGFVKTFLNRDGVW
jgi:hypothetical protein